MEPTRLDRDLEQIIRENGVNDVLAAFCRWCHKNGYRGLFTKLNKIYEQLVIAPVSRKS